MDNNEELIMQIMQLISMGGDAKSSAMEAIYLVKEGNFEESQQKLDDAQEALNNAHNTQTALLTKEASGEKVEISLLMVHAQDHLMNAITFNDMAKEIVELYRKIG